ncbi:MAG: Panacea domain-containing protein, partial [Fusobacteriaceae bacterium]
SYLLVFEYKIFDENPEAWAHGPVFRSVYDKYSSYGYRCIDIPSEDVSLHEKTLENFVLKIAGGYGKFSAKDLEHLTHKEKPWIDSRKCANVKDGEFCTEKILDSDIKSYFKNLLEI